MASPLAAAGPEGQHVPDTMLRAVTKAKLDVCECRSAQDTGKRKPEEMPETQLDWNSDTEQV